jgi:hypothetical protein
MAPWIDESDTKC